MKLKLIVTLLVLTFMSVAPSVVKADAGEPDTLIILTSRPEAGADDSTFIVEVWAYNDMEGIAPQLGFSWESEYLTLVSAVPSAEAATAFQTHFVYDKNSVDTSNANDRAMYAGISFMGTWFPASATRHLVCTYTFTLTDWTVASEIFVDTLQWDGGSRIVFVTPTGENIPIYAYGDADIWVRDPSDVGANGLPAVYSLSQNYPNPFNPETTIEFTLEQPGEYTFTVYNVIGQIVHEESGIGNPNDVITIPFNGSNHASGVYFYKLESGSFTETKKMMLVK